MALIRRLLVTGSRNFENRSLMEQVFTRLLEQHQWSADELVLVSGHARGADKLAEDIFEGWGLKVEQHPADWDTFGRRAGPVRNAEMVKLGADVCVAFPLGASVGTRDCMRRADKANIPVFEVDTLTQQVSRWGTQHG